MTTLREQTRRRLLALLLGVPMLLAASAVAVTEVWRIARPTSPLFMTPPASSFADMIAAGDALRTYELIRSGRDPNEPLIVQHPVLTGGRSIAVSPLMWAVATESNQVVFLLLNTGARLDAATQRRAWCLAGRLGSEEVVQYLEASSPVAAAAPCAPDESRVLLADGE